MYGVLYALSPELFPTKDRGTGNALVATANRVFGVMVRVLPAAECTSRLEGPDRRAVRQSDNVGADIHIGRPLPGCRVHCAHVTF